jgi:hypothetical protein
LVLEGKLCIHLPHDCQTGQLRERALVNAVVGLFMGFLPSIFYDSFLAYVIACVGHISFGVVMPIHYVVLAHREDKKWIEENPHHRADGLGIFIA